MMADWLAESLAPAVPWPALAVVLPLTAALVSAVGQRAAQAVVAPAALASLLAALATTFQVARHGTVTVSVGGWLPPLGIGLRADGLACAFVLVSALAALAALLFARDPVRAGPAREAASFWPLAFGLLAALNTAFLAADLFNLYVALELLTVCAVALVALSGSREALGAALRYLMFALLGSLAYLLGVVLIYVSHGTLDLAQLAGAGFGDGPHAAAAAALLSVGLMAKAALFPLHGWLASAHAAAPAPASALLSALVVKAPVLLLVRLWFDVFAGLGTPALGQFMGALGTAAILLGSLLALRQSRIKLVIAYSTVAQLGYLLLLFPLATGVARSEPWAATAWLGVVLHALAHALAKAAMFLSAGAMAEAAGHDRLEGFAGMGHAMPLAASAFALAAVSLMGLPPSGGFLGKYLLLVAALASGQWWWAVVMLVGGLLAAAYLFRPMSCLLGAAPATLAQPVPRARQALGLVLALAAVVLGIASAGPVSLLLGTHLLEPLP